MANWVLLTDYLHQATDDVVTLTWTELDRVVGGLPASASRHRAWWSGDRTHVRAWRSAGFAVTDLHPGERVSFSRRPSPMSRASVQTSFAEAPAPLPQSAVLNAGPRVGGDLLLVTCARSKQSQPAAAKDLYVSPLFRMQRAYAERAGVPWYILSAEYGLVPPDQWIAPYERYLPDTSLEYRAAWGSWVAAKLELLAGPVASQTIEIHAGSTYLNAVRPHLEALGARVTDPLHGLRMGERLAWYNAHAPATPVTQSAGLGVSRLVGILCDESLALSPKAFLATGGTDLKRPGLYSWWVDGPGAQDLSRGLGLPVQPGLIYAGLAGATRWPSGKQSTNTLWSRIAGMHLGRRHEFSTFRRTIGAILAHTAQSSQVDEMALTEWMRDHLRVITVPHDDADTLGKVEESVLELLDPPLNLQGMNRTPIREQLRTLRTAVS